MNMSTQGFSKIRVFSVDVNEREPHAPPSHDSAKIDSIECNFRSVRCEDHLNTLMVPELGFLFCMGGLRQSCRVQRVVLFGEQLSERFRKLTYLPMHME